MELHPGERVPRNGKAWVGSFRAQMKKTQLCRYHQLGSCRNGASCSFAHTSEELQHAPDLMKTSLCQAWLQGKCSRDAADCHFAHGHRELRRTPVFQRKKGGGYVGDDPSLVNDAASSTGSTSPSGSLGLASLSSRSSSCETDCRHDLGEASLGSLAGFEDKAGSDSAQVAPYMGCSPIAATTQGMCPFIPQDGGAVGVYTLVPVMIVPVAVVPTECA
mmetsp:Transcript_31120/g.56834  ORF Transcript_31120/g.56834 Transcript_31120/m.56834 type:complete len:218 (-) Transcript_31120:98-751(-)